MRFLQSILSVIGVLGPQLPQHPSLAELSFPSLPLDHPASIQFLAWLSAFNTADEKTLLAYHSGSNFPYSVASRDIGDINRELGLARATGGFHVADVESSSEPSSVLVVLKEKNRGHYARASMVVDISKPNYPATKFEIHPTITPIKFIPKDDPRRPRYEKALVPLTTVMRRAVLDGIANVLREQYIYPELAEEMISALDTHFNDGNYDGFEESEKFARRLTDDLHATGHDQHMMIGFFEPPPERNGTDNDRPHKARKHLEDLRRMDFGFGSISLDNDTVPGRTIATLPINGFVPSVADFASDWQEIREAIGVILSSVADADALLVDLRDNHGGSPDTVAFVLSYLLDNGPLHLLDFVDRSGKVEKTFSTIPVNQLPAGTNPFGGTKPLFVLTTSHTISGGEDMAYSLQAFKRSKAIIGEGNEATAGAANPITHPRFICEEIFGKGWWLVAVPSVKPVHSITGSNWEGVGVKSDVIAGKGKWDGVRDAQEVGRRLVRQYLEPEMEL